MKLFQKPEPKWLISSILAAAILGGAFLFPLWRLELIAPQYPAGLVMYAYGWKFADSPDTYYNDVAEINGLNHYIGMRAIETVTEMKLFIPGVSLLILGTLLSGFVAFQGKWIRRIIVAGFWFIPIFFVLDLQFWLWRYGQTLDPDAALTMDPFTPKVWGTTKVWNFHSETGFELGFWCMIAAALVISFLPMVLERVPRLLGRFRQSKTAQTSAVTGMRVALVLAAIAGGGAALLVGDGHGVSAQTAATLQQRIDDAEPQDIIVVEGGVYNERIRIDKPISLVGRSWPVIDGGGDGDIVTIASDDVVISGFELRNSGHAVSQEPAAIKLNGFGGATITGNRVVNSYFGIHITNATGVTITENDLRAGEGVPQERRAHGLYLWKVNDSTITNNDVRFAADGIHLEFADHNYVVRNTVRDSRYALHFMYAHRNTVVENYLTDNLSGAVLMFSHELVVKDNEFSSNRAGATGAGMLLKDNDNFFAEGNRLLRNKYGMTVEGTPQSAGTTAIFRRNTFALNDVGIALTTNSPITFVENAVIDNSIQVKAMSANAAASLSSHTSTPDADVPASGDVEVPGGAVWSSAGRGNYWSDYRGYDQDGDGVGDQPYLPKPPFAGRLKDDESLQLFQHTLAQQAIDIAADMFPLYRYDAVIEDAAPLMEPPDGIELAGSSRFNVPLLVLSGGLLALSLTAAVWAGALRLPVAQRRQEAGTQGVT